MNRLLYLGFAFPPGVASAFPEWQPAGHYIETNLIDSIRPWFDIRSVGVFGVDIGDVTRHSGASPGLPHALNLFDKSPEILVRRQSLATLKQAYLEWLRSNWRPDLIMVCNLSPVYNAFVRWLHTQPDRPQLVLYLADSTGIDVKISMTRRLRYRFKPMVWLDEQMLPYFDACVAVSRSTQKSFAGVPWLWLPNGVDPRRARSPDVGPAKGPVVFGYFGSLAPHAGLPQLIDIWSSGKLDNPLHVAGFGKAKDEIAARCASNGPLSFHGTLSPDECLQFASECDVLVNPRPDVPGNDNNFSSKVFEFALSGRAILTSRLSGVDEVLGDEAFYFDHRDFERSLTEALRRVADTPRPELRRRGAALQLRLLKHYTWTQQGEKLARFLQGVLHAWSSGCS